MSSSRREARDSDSKRRSSSKYDREPSPKRSRRDGRHGAEKGRGNDDGEAQRGRDYDEKDRRRRVEDPLASEAPSNKVEDVVASKGWDKKTDERKDSDKKADGSKDSDKKADERKDSDKKVDERKDSDKKVDGAKEAEKKENGSERGRKHSSDAAEIPRTQSHFQHDDRGNTRRSDRSYNQRAASDRGWGRDYRDRRGDREANWARNHGLHSRDDKFADREKGDRVWRHDGFFELEANPRQSKKRPAFSEKKIAAAAADGDKSKTEKPNNPVGGERDERGGRISRGGRRPFPGDRGFTKGDQPGFGAPSRDRYDGSGGSYRARDGTTARQGPHSAGVSDKWKHDLFNEANRSPTPKNEEDQIAKVEALLAS